MGMSSPRDATSVATRMLRSPDLNLLSAARRLGCDICPWMGTAPNPKFLCDGGAEQRRSSHRAAITVQAWRAQQGTTRHRNRQGWTGRVRLWGVGGEHAE